MERINPNTHWREPLLIGLLTTAIFTVDLLTPLGIGITTLYISVMLLAVWRLKKSTLVFFACGCSLLTIAGYFLSPPGTAENQALINRSIAIVTIWAVAASWLFRRNNLKQLDLLRADANILRSLVSATPNAVLAVDDTGYIRFANPKAHQLFGYAINELIHMNVDALVPDDVHQHHGKLRERYLQEPEARAMGAGRELFARRKDGSKFPVEIGLNPLDIGGKPLVLTEIIDISVRKQLQNELQQNERQLRLITDSLPVLIAYIGNDQRFRFINKTGCVWFSTNAHNLVGKHSKIIFGEHAYQQAMPHIDRVMRGEHAHFISKIPLQRQQLIDVDISLVPDFHPQTNRVAGYFALIQNISEQLHAEAENRRLAAIVTTSKDAILSTDLDGKILSWNLGAERLYGYSAADIIGKSIRQLMPSHRQDEFATLQQAMIDGEQVVTHETQRRTHSGIDIDVMISLSPLKDANGKVIGVASISRDISERIRAEERLRQTVESTPNVMIMTNSSGTIVMQNRAVNTVLGYSENELNEQNISQLIPPEAGHNHPLAYFANNINSTNNEPTQTSSNPDIKNLPSIYYCLHRDGHVVPLQIGRNPLSTRDGFMWLFSFVDMSERIRFEQELADKNTALTNSNRELDDFAYLVSHDLKEPLRGIASFANFLKEDYAARLDDQGREMLDTLVRLPKRLEGLIEALLYYSRVGRSELQLQKTNINALVHEICDTLQVFLAEKNAEVLLPEPLPEVVCDRARINEVFMNLITNGVKYNDKKNITIEIGCETTAGGFVFYVKDNGIGIKPEHHERIFRMFKRLHHRDAFGGGTGAGLAFVKRIIETHKGRIWVESTPEQGSTFYFTLPEGA